MNIKFENNELRNFNKSNFNVLTKLFLINNKIFKKITIYRNFINRFNVYINLYFDEIASKYIISNNVIIFFKKDKHRYEFQIKKNSFLIDFLI